MIKSDIDNTEKEHESNDLCECEWRREVRPLLRSAIDGRSDICRLPMWVAFNWMAIVSGQ
jgi:hypothetical protein